ncbi:MAG: DUF4368 domain-containing protein [Ruminococcus sp.]|nr:DUF4368 domain-containing protein [Ruminococcus sp.]
MIYNILADSTTTSATQSAAQTSALSGNWTMYIFLGVILLLFIVYMVFSSRRSKKQEQELEKVLRRMADLYPDLKDGIINVDQYRIMKEKYEQAQRDLTQSIQKLKASLGQAEDDTVATNDFIEHFKKHGNIKSLNRPILTELIDRIVVHKDGTLDIAFNFCDAFAAMQKRSEERSA